MFNIQEILSFLPHRYPFLMVDRILEYTPGERIVGLKNVTINEPFFQGHFPDMPIMPGVLMIEAMAQVGGCLVVQGMEKRNEKLIFFMGIEKARFRKPVRPGDQLRIEMVVDRLKSRVGKLDGKIYVEDQIVCEAKIMFSLVDRAGIGREAG
jgi:beta-hydroxyacyl-ACP dehydratase FabZ